jgi:predicted DNA-binding transcriptional regulator YafY
MQQLECSRATVNRAIRALRDDLGAPIDYDRALNGYRFAGGGIYELPGFWLNASEMLDAPAREITDAELDAHFKSGYGIFAGVAKQTAVLRFTSEQARWVADEHWHPNQQGKLLPDGSYELRVPYADPREPMMQIIKYGPDVEVIGPAELCSKIAERAERMAALYCGSGFSRDF